MEPIAKVSWPISVLAFILTPLIGMTASWLIMGVASFVMLFLSVAWMVSMMKQGQLRGQIIKSEEDGETVYAFVLNGDVALMDLQDKIIFEVVRESAGNSSP